MNTASAPARTPETSNYINLWLNCLSAVLAEKIGAAVSCVALPASSNLPSISEDDTWITISASGQLKGELAFRLPLAFRQSVTSSPVGDVDTLLLEIFNLSAAGVQKRMESKCVVTHQAKKTPAPSWDPSSVQVLQAQFANPATFELRLENTLLESLQSIVSPPPGIPPSITGTEKLGMLMGVELAVTMRFGGKRMLLKDILDLCTGSVVELEQQVQEPVDLLLDGRLIARGEVVVVDGNYGLRITEVVSGDEK